MAGLLLKTTFIGIEINDIRGLILAAPVVYGMYEAGGPLMAIWIGPFSLGGIVLSVLVPLLAARKIKTRPPVRLGATGLSGVEGAG